VIDIADRALIVQRSRYEERRIQIRREGGREGKREGEKLGI